MANHGGKRQGAGRKPGTLNERTQELVAVAAATGETPIEYMLRIMRDQDADIERRDKMAIAAAPFVHPKLATLNHTGQFNIKRWSDEQLALAREVLSKIETIKPAKPTIIDGVETLEVIEDTPKPA